MRPVGAAPEQGRGAGEVPLPQLGRADDEHGEVDHRQNVASDAQGSDVKELVDLGVTVADAGGLRLRQSVCMGIKGPVNHGWPGEWI